MSSQTPTISKATISEILCAVLRGDSMEWPDFSEADFYDALLEQAILDLYVSGEREQEAAGHLESHILRKKWNDS